MGKRVSGTPFLRVSGMSPLLTLAGGAYVPTVVVGMCAPFGVVGVCHATICMPWAFITALWHVEDLTMGADHDFASSSRLIRFS
jgi:hypothetical protein